MGRLEDYRALAQGQLAVNGDVLYPLTAPWSDGTAARYGVRDPNRSEGQRGLTRLQTDPLPASLRLLRVHPEDALPALGSAVAFQGGLLVLGLWTDQSAYTGQRVGVCRLVDERAYPLTATVAHAVVPLAFMLRIEALTTGPVQADGLSFTADGSHRAFLPPGVLLSPSDVITTVGGDHYQVVPPVQRDALGDTVGLSWMGREALPDPLPEPDSPDPTPGTTDPQPGETGIDPRWFQ